MNRPPRGARTVNLTNRRDCSAPRRGRRFVPVVVAFALTFTAGERAVADVNESGNVSPTFTRGPVVDLTGQRIFIGTTPGGVGSIGTVNVTSGGVLTAAQIVPGTGGLGTGFVNVTGAGSRINLTGGAASNGLDIGSWGTGVVNVSNGGLIACATVAACAFNGIGDAAGSTGTLSINGGAVTGLGTLAVGQGVLQAGFGTPGANTSATLSITNGGSLSSSGFNSVANNSGQTGRVTGNVTIDGAGSQWMIARDLAGGGGQAGISIAPTANSVANVTLSNGGNLSITGSRSNPATDSSLPFLNLSAGAGATSTMTVTTGASVVFGGNTGVITVGGNSSVASPGSTATLNITSGGTVSGTGANGLLFVVAGQNQGSGTINISGQGSQLLVAGVGGQNTQGLDGVGGLVVIGRTRGGGGGSGTLNVTGGGTLSISDNGLPASTGSMGLQLASGVGSSGAVTVSGVGSSIVVSSTNGSTATSPYVLIGNGGNGQMTISDGATVSILGSGPRNFTVNNAATGLGVLTMTNGASIFASRFAIADSGGSGTATIDGSTVNLDGVIFFNGTPIGAGVRVGRGDGADGLLTLQNGSVINVNNSISNASVILGGTSSLAGGTGTLNMSSGSSINFTGTAASASLQVGGVGGTGFMSMTGASTVHVGATGSATIGSIAGSTGTLTVGGGSSIAANVIGIGGNSDTAAGGTGTAVVTGAGSALNATGANAFLAVGRGGSGSLSVSDGGALNATVVSIGRADGGFGTLTVDAGAINLSGQQTAGGLSGASLSIGSLGGTGSATIRNGSVVTISNPGTSGVALNVGGNLGNPGGSGVLNVSNSTVNLLAAPGQAAVRIGHDGNGIATFTGSTMNVGNPTATAADGSLMVAGQPGSTGTLSLNAGTVVNAGYVGVGATASGPGGTGTVILNNSTLNTATFELGARGLLSGDGGIINASGDVIIGGTISPGNSPGRITINCNLITLPGSMLILEILGSGNGFAIDHLRIGRDSTFDLRALHIVFSFLGNTDPNSFVASGGFDLDNFIQSIDVATGAVSGLSTAFAAGQTWADVLNPAGITAISSFYDISNLQLRPDGTVNVVAVPVPEPSTWAMLAIGLMALSSMARRRALARRR